ncbi:hypothetical protein FJZ26_01385 [Candidatus Parvarchaeota archaeon]|nr:hypothetical protein [Candidatus Parvarchaeota archaeon]
MQELTIITENKVGVLASVCQILGGCGVNIESICAQGNEDGGVIRLVTSDIATAKRELEKGKFTVKAGELLVVKLNDNPGELAKLTRRIARNGVDIECVYLLSKHKGVVEVAIKPGDLEAAKAALK